MVTPAPDDPRLQPGAYISSGVKLGEVLESSESVVAVQDCRTDGVFSIAPWLLCLQWELVREAPTAPTYVDECVAVATVAA